VPYSVLDIETSGLNYKHDAILAIGLVEIDQGRIQLDRRWYTMVRPPEEMMVQADSIRIHGLLRGELSQAPPCEEVLLELVERLCRRVPVVYMASIDIKFISQALQNYFKVKMRGPAIDTRRLASTLQLHADFLSGYVHNEDIRPTTLRSLAQQSNVPVHAQHHALSDALTTAQLFLAQATQLQQRGKTTFHKLMRVGGCLR
jgi:DNA polymerase-3 subunit epsilon